MCHLGLDGDSLATVGLPTSLEQAQITFGEHPLWGRGQEHWTVTSNRQTAMRENKNLFQLGQLDLKIRI